MCDLAGENGLDLEALRTRLRCMSDDELNRFGQAARYMCSPAVSHRNESTFKTYNMRMAVRLCLPEYVPRVAGTAPPYRTTWFKRRLFSSSRICRIVRLKCTPGEAASKTLWG